MWMILSLYNTCIEILFPSSCFLCKRAHTPLCMSCVEKIPLAVTTPSSSIESLFSFRDPSVKKIIRAGKYFGRKDLLLAIAKHATHYLSRSEYSDITLCVPVPMHPLRKMMRGYNQSELIAQIFALHLNKPCDTRCIIKYRNTKRQVTTHSRKERLRNLHGSFVVQGNVRGKRILLVDDVTTTGATLTTVQEELLRAGAQEIRAVTLAH